MHGAPDPVPTQREPRTFRAFLRSWECILAGLAALLFGFLFFFGYLNGMENRILDARFRHRGELSKCPDVVLVSITDDCIEDLGTWPWPRSRHAQLLKALNKAGAKVVAFDVMFNEPSLQGEDDDQKFALAVKEAGNVVLPITIIQKLVLDNDTCEMVERIVAERAIPCLRQNQRGEGFIDMEYKVMNVDGVLRHLFLERRIDDSYYRIFGLAAVSAFLQKKVEPLEDGVRVGERFLPYYTRYNLASGGKVRSFMVNYAGPTNFFDDVSCSDVLSGRFDQNLLRDRLVIVGTRARGTSEDVKFSPFGAMAGMEVHANLAHNVLTGQMLRRFSPVAFAAMLLILAVAIGAVLYWIPGMGGNLVTLVVYLTWMALGWLMFHHNLVLELAPVMLMLPIQWATTRLVRQFYDLRERNRELAKKVRELSIVNEVSQAVNFIGDLAKTLDTILSRAVQALGAKRGSLMMLDDRYETLVERSVVFGVEGEIVMNPELKAKFKLGEGIAGAVFQSGKPRLIEDVLRAPEFQTLKEDSTGLRSMICVPLQVRESPIGVMNIVNRDCGRFDEEDLQLALTMANQAAVVIEKARLYNLATIDGLTGLIVHRHFQSRLEEEFRRSKRYDKPLSLLMTDIDHFKKFNDTWGHQIGDLVLREVAKCVHMSIRDTDVAARYGGEEFAIILPETDVEGAGLFAERLRQKVEQSRFQGPKGDLQVTISLGLSSIPENVADSTLELIRLADEALYAAKHGGRNRVGISPPTPPPDDNDQEPQTTTLTALPADDGSPTESDLT